jgi:5-methyltetrahydropteroyltriglutamate--homocysteine methyltransferase
MTNTFRADQVGSLLRPKKLLDARRKFEKGEIEKSELRAIEDESILGVLKMQKESGISVCTDGEYRRSTWLDAFYDVADGWAMDEAAPELGQIWQGPTKDVANEMHLKFGRVTKRMSLSGRFTDHETRFLKQHAPLPYKVTMASPTMYLGMFRPGVGYADLDDFLDHLVSFYATEVAGQVADGAAYIQLDSLRYVQALGGQISKSQLPIADVEKEIARTMRADSGALAPARAAGVITAVHMCRGNHRSAWSRTGSYDRVAEQLFSGADVDRFLLEYDDERSGGFEPLRFVPKGKIVVLGLVTSKRGELEDPDFLAKRIDAASKFIPLDQLAISPQCGFASTELGNLLTEDDQKRKLELVASVARRVWG